MINNILHTSQCLAVTVSTRAVIAMGEVPMSSVDMNIMDASNMIDDVSLMSTIAGTKSTVALVEIHYDILQ